MTKISGPVYRTQMAQVAGMTPVQLDYLVRLGVVTPDLGGKRKHYSEHEMRLAIVAGAIMKFHKDSKSLKQQMAHIREIVRWPGEDQNLPVDQMYAIRTLEVFKKAREGEATEPAISNLCEIVRKNFRLAGLHLEDRNLFEDPRHWDDDTLTQSEDAIFFRRAAAGPTPFYLGADLESESWRWVSAGDINEFDKFESLICINVGRLFARVFAGRGS